VILLQPLEPMTERGGSTVQPEPEACDG
jgi:hypothetical protein